MTASTRTGRYQDSRLAHMVFCHASSTAICPPVHSYPTPALKVVQASPLTARAVPMRLVLNGGRLSRGRGGDAQHVSNSYRVWRQFQHKKCGLNKGMTQLRFLKGKWGGGQTTTRPTTSQAKRQPEAEAKSQRCSHTPQRKQETTRLAATITVPPTTCSIHMPGYKDRASILHQET